MNPLRVACCVLSVLLGLALNAALAGEPIFSDNFRDLHNWDIGSPLKLTATPAPNGPGWTLADGWLRPVKVPDLKEGEEVYRMALAKWDSPADCTVRCTVRRRPGMGAHGVVFAPRTRPIACWPASPRWRPSSCCNSLMARSMCWPASTAICRRARARSRSGPTARACPSCSTAWKCFRATRRRRQPDVAGCFRPHRPTLSSDTSRFGRRSRPSKRPLPASSKKPTCCRSRATRPASSGKR